MEKRIVILSRKEGPEGTAVKIYKYTPEEILESMEEDFDSSFTFEVFLEEIPEKFVEDFSFAEEQEFQEWAWSKPIP